MRIISNGTIENSDISNSADIASSKVKAGAANRVIITDGSSNLEASNITNVELNALAGIGAVATIETRLSTAESDIDTAESDIDTAESDIDTLEAKTLLTEYKSLAGTISNALNSPACSPGYELVGGGCKCGGSLNFSYPDSINSKWSCECSSVFSNKAYAICAKW